MRNLENNTNLFGSHSLLKGRVIFEPEYKTQELREYENNPFIEALPIYLRLMRLQDNLQYIRMLMKTKESKELL
jgi:hypothetical protein